MATKLSFNPITGKLDLVQDLSNITEDLGLNCNDINDVGNIQHGSSCSDPWIIRNDVVDGEWHFRWEETVDGGNDYWLQVRPNDDFNSSWYGGQNVISFNGLDWDTTTSNSFAFPQLNFFGDPNSQTNPSSWDMRQTAFGTTVSWDLRNSSTQLYSFSIGSSDASTGSISLVLASPIISTNTIGFGGAFDAQFSVDSGQSFLFDAPLAGGTTDSDNLTISANTVDYLYPATGRIQFSHPTNFNLITTFPSNVSTSLLEWSGIKDVSGLNQIIIPGFQYVPTFEYDTAQLLTAAYAFNGSPVFRQEASTGAHTIFFHTGFFAGPGWENGFNGTGTPPNLMAAYVANPTIRRQTGTTGTATAPTIAGYETFMPNLLKVLFNTFDVGTGMTVTRFSHFKANSNVTAALRVQSGGAITTEVGLDLNTLTTGTTQISIWSNSTTATMRHAGSSSWGHTNAPNFRIDTLNGIRIRPVSGIARLYLGGVGASDWTHYFDLNTTSNRLRLASANQTNNQVLEFDIENEANKIRLLPASDTTGLELDFDEGLSFGSTSLAFDNPKNWWVQYAVPSGFAAEVAGTDQSLIDLTFNGNVSNGGFVISNYQTWNISAASLTGGGSWTNAATLRVAGAPSGGTVTNRYALWVTGASATSFIQGNLRIGAALDHDGSTVGFYGTTPAAQAGATDDIKDALTSYGLLQGSSATPLDLDGGTLSAGIGEFGDQGSEAGGVNLNGTTYDTEVKISEIGGTLEAMFSLHRHSTTLPCGMITSRSNSDTSSHGAVVAGQVLWRQLHAGWTGSHYDVFADIRALVDDSGTISATSSPGRLQLRTVPDGSNTPTLALDIDNAQDVDLPNGQLAIAGDTGGIASRNVYTGATDTPTTDPGWTTSSTVDMNAPDGYIKAYVGTQAVVLPYWNT